MRHLAILIAGLVLVLAPSESRALFHVAHISEIMSGVNGDPTVQYVEIRMNAPAQNFVTNSFLTAFNCDGTSHSVLLQVPMNVLNSGVGVKWLMATTSFQAVAGIAPDFTWNPGTSGNIDPMCGMVCWGGTGVLSPTMPDPANPNSYVDCVGYGGYSGSRKTSIHDGTPTSGTPTALNLTSGTTSLTRTGFTGSNTADFALAPPTPTNNAGMTGLGGATTTTTLAGGSTTTSTTVPATACTDIATCRTRLGAVLPSPAAATSAKSRKVAVKLGKLATAAGKALDKAGSLTGKKQQKQFKKAKTALNKLLAKARAANTAGTLPGPLAPLEAAVNALLAQIP